MPEHRSAAWVVDRDGRAVAREDWDWRHHAYRLLQSERMVRALKAAGKNVTVAVLAGEDHWLSRTDTRVQVLKELDAFLGKSL